MCDKVANRCFLAFIYISDWYKNQKLCDSVVSEDSFIIKIWIKSDLLLIKDKFFLYIIIKLILIMTIILMKMIVILL